MNTLALELRIFVSVAGIHAVWCQEGRFYVAIDYSFSVLFESGEELPRGLPYVFTGTVLTMGSVSNQELLTRINTVQKGQNSSPCLAEHFYIK